MKKQKRAVFVVEDSPQIMERMNRISEEIDNSPVVMNAGSYRESVAMLTRLNPDKVLLDIPLQEKNGNELLHIIRDQQMEIIVLIIT